MRILEIGSNALFHVAAPRQTDFYWSGLTLPKGLPRTRGIGPLRLLRLLRAVARGDYDLVVVHPNLYPVWHPRAWGKIAASFPLTALHRMFAAAAPWFFRHARGAPVVLVDQADSFGLQRHVIGMAGAVSLVFKRELPQDKWLVFYRTGHRRLPTKRFRAMHRFRRIVDKLRPIGLPPYGPARPIAEPEKTADVFFAGQTFGTSTLREEAIAELRALAAEGISVDIPESPLDQAAFYRRLSAAWLAWSPAGFGWECFRHYEAPLTGTVPVMNYPTIHRYAPLADGEHCFFYSPEPGGLAACIRAALADKDRLRAMARAAQAHVLAHHGRRAVADYICRESLGRDLAGRAVGAAGMAAKPLAESAASV
ncbi:MAG: glycosyltransferase [Azospirillaceae bacterium]